MNSLGLLRSHARKLLLDKSRVSSPVRQRRLLSGESVKPGGEAPAAEVEAPASSGGGSESFRDVAGFLVLSIVSGGYLLWEVKDLGQPQPKKKKSE